MTPHGGGRSRGEGARSHGRAKRFLFASALCLAALGPAVASAAPSAADRETARGLLKDGDKSFDAKDYRAALKNYEAAHAIMGLPSTGFAVAKTRAAVGLLVEARDVALEVTRIPAKPGDPAAFARAKESAGKLAEELARRIPNLELTVQGGPESGEIEIRLDGEAVPVASLGSPRKANPGRHEVSASAAGYKPVSAHVDLAEGETKAVTLELQAEAGAVAPAAAPPPAETTSAVVEDKPSGTKLSPLVYVGFGVGAAGIVTGAVTGIIHLNKVSSVKDEYCNGGDACRPGFEEERDSAKTFATIANIAFGVGIAGVAVGVVGLFTSKPAESSVQAQARPRVVPEIGLGSVSVRGTF